MTTTTPTIDLMNARCSTRAYAEEPITEDEKAAILHATMRAPTAGNMMLYSIVEIDDQALKAAPGPDLRRPAVHRPGALGAAVRRRPAEVDGSVRRRRRRPLPDVPQNVTPGPGDLMLACCDALIAAQNAVIAAESLGIGSCYIGDILEQAQTHADAARPAALDLPHHACAWAGQR